MSESNAVASVIEALKGMTALELAELKNQIEEVFGVTAAAPVAVAAPAGGGAAAAEAEEQTAFKVELKEVGANKIQVIKAVRAITSLGLKEAKDVVDGAPSVVKADVSKEEAAKMKQELEAAGATVAIS